MKPLTQKRSFAKLTLAATTVISIILLSGCAASELKAPCKNYGQWCKRQPVNGWAFDPNANEQ